MQQTEAIKASTEWKKRSIVKDFTGSVIERISKEWMLITSGVKSDYNTMTASWGSVGYLWERSVVFIFVRPTRHTYSFMGKNEHFTLTFFDKQLKSSVHKICGSKSGRDIDKAKEAEITPIYFDDDVISFEEAKEIIVCKKIYISDFKPENFADKNIDNLYPAKDYHRIYIGEIEKFYQK
ncbi:MAG: flavin reductase [Campylobacteraceae bacterium]|jgi:flavin reductase (DIM6/NTAB) family NADH-FMN oxidoreductase RutF|nr:flavin reductase [Campylobacteraceae bacterium]